MTLSSHKIKLSYLYKHHWHFNFNLRGFYIITPWFFFHFSNWDKYYLDYSSLYFGFEIGIGHKWNLYEGDIASKFFKEVKFSVLHI